MSLEPNLRVWSGPYRTSAVDWIEKYVVTEEMLQSTIDQRRQTEPEDIDAWAAYRRKIRRNIAIGIRAGTYRRQV